MPSCESCKLDELPDASAVEDRISSLPDEIIQHILSFIPTRDAVATTVLSTRWMYLWICVPNIDLDDFMVYPTRDPSYIRPIYFRNFVETVLHLHICLELKKFRLSCQACFYRDDIDSWISAAIKRNVQELDLCLRMIIPFALPSCTFYSRTLTVLTIDMKCPLQLPACISLPALKALHLVLVTFLDDGSTERLLSGCPSLEELGFYECDWRNLKLIRISIPTLKSLILDDMPCCGPVSAYKLNRCQVVIGAENLSSFKYRGYLLNDICARDLSTLVYAYINIRASYDTTKETARCAFKMLTALQSVKSLQISDGIIQCLSLADTSTDNLPIFPNLTYLEFNDEVGKLAIQMLVDFLSYTPNLESLVLSEGLDLDLCLGEGDLLLNPVPKCILACLKSVSLHKFSASATEVYVLKSLLETAPMLERLNVTCRRYIPGHPKKVDEVCAQVMMLPRLSSSCVISIVRKSFGSVS